ncbi:hypothetical protein CLU79DRAFT_777233 [Phycomyces nitens]|nr:hypothetical protein CLU79DRAFT_777233 [Phycomyces nitens]
MSHTALIHTPLSLSTTNQKSPGDEHRYPKRFTKQRLKPFGSAWLTSSESQKTKIEPAKKSKDKEIINGVALESILHPQPSESTKSKIKALRLKIRQALKAPPTPTPYLRPNTEAIPGLRQSPSDRLLNRKVLSHSYSYSSPGDKNITLLDRTPDACTPDTLVPIPIRTSLASKIKYRFMDKRKARLHKSASFSAAVQPLDHKQFVGPTATISSPLFEVANYTAMDEDPRPDPIRQRKEARRLMSVRFGETVSVHSALSKYEYDRGSDPEAACTRLTAELAMSIKEELNTYKIHEMHIHPDSRCYTHLFPV